MPHQVSEGGACMEITVSSYFYKTTAPAVLAAIQAWDAKRAELDEKRMS